MREASAEGSNAAAGSVAKVLLACDTRPSSPALMAAAAAGVQALGGVAVDCGRLTTPAAALAAAKAEPGLALGTEGLLQYLGRGVSAAGQRHRTIGAGQPFLPFTLPLFRASMTSAPHRC